MFIHLETKCCFGTKSADFEYRNILNAYFSNSFSQFSAGILLSCPADDGKRAGLFFSLLKKEKGLFLTSKKRHGAFLTSKIKMGRCGTLQKIWTLLNFVKNLFFSYWISLITHFPHIEFCKESIFLILNFVKNLFF